MIRNSVVNFDNRARSTTKSTQQCYSWEKISTKETSVPLWLKWRLSLIGSGNRGVVNGGVVNRSACGNDTPTTPSTNIPAAPGPLPQGSRGPCQRRRHVRCRAPPASPPSRDLRAVLATRALSCTQCHPSE